MATKEDVLAALLERLADPTLSRDVFLDFESRVKIIQQMQE